MRNILIMGPMGSGKTTLADMIQELSNKYRKFSLGTKLKQHCDLFGQTGRSKYQQYGQNVREIFGEDAWNIALAKVIDDYDPWKVWKIVIDDGRQHSEYNFWKDRGYVTIGIMSDSMTRVQRIFERDGVMTTREQLSHDTEKQASECFEKCDYRIFNTGTLEDLREEARKIIKLLEESK